MNTVEEHRREAPDTVACMIVTVSDTRTTATDKSGQLMRELLEREGYIVAAQTIVKDDYDQVRSLITTASEHKDIQAVLLTGGTGISRRDTTFEAVTSLLDKELTGFGEIFRSLSYEEIGSAAILSRAIGGTVGDTAVFSMPGSANAVRLAMEKILLPELRHVVREIRKPQ
ncbi:MogA/MoaB family molybdenum cofactor biosynthesis protein [Paenibacillus lemnae]|uniref:Molybdenum cofactor biosynthesis protein B n=1 Tax=Paenibacillus lemnae TaxID=1330551 RepID=A0A848M8N5_PAELE|nr:molybdenum cofactor biosynthesis protein B [Paenibacillus lemnae]NMO96253.1 molybdenum cofactor biosynthesis protein MoaB [Paenibacillus lemnae]